MSGWASEATARLRDAFEAHRNPVRAAPIERYMRDQFPFIGLLSSERRALAREALKGVTPPNESDLAGMVRALWLLPEREYQHAGCDLATRWVKMCGPGFVATLEWLVTTKSWWDTVDALAANVAGPLVAAHEAELSGLSKREALLWLDGRRKRAQGEVAGAR